MPRLTKITVTAQTDHLVTLLITPPVWAGVSPKTIEVTPTDWKSIQAWMSGGGMIDKALPHWTPSQREILLTGYDDNDWDKAIKNDDNSE